VINSRLSHELAVNGALFLDTSTKAEIPDDGGLFNQQKPTNRWSISLTRWLDRTTNQTFRLIRRSLEERTMPAHVISSPPYRNLYRLSVSRWNT